MSDYTEEELQDWTPEVESYEEATTKKCHICQSIIYDDGTAEDCQGECDLSIADRLSPDEELDFNK